MRGKQAKKLRDTARMLYMTIPEIEGKTKKSVSDIYDELKRKFKSKK